MCHRDSNCSEMNECERCIEVLKGIWEKHPALDDFIFCPKCNRPMHENAKTCGNYCKQGRNKVKMPIQELSWEIPRNASEICRVLTSAILKQWMIPMIDFEDSVNGYDVSENKSIFLIKSHKKQYRVTIEELDG